jgi:hypothetical protein
MPHVESGHHEDDVLGDVRCVIANPLEMSRNEDQVERRLDGALILQHVREQIAEDLGLQTVEAVVLAEDTVRQVGVAPDIGIERVAQHRLGDIAHLRDVDQLLDWRMSDVSLAGLGDVDGKIADALEVSIDLDGRDNRAKVGGHWLMQCQQTEAPVIDLDVQLVDRFVPGQDLVDDGGIARDQSLEGGTHPLFRQPAHLEQSTLQRFELLTEMGDLPLH